MRGHPLVGHTIAAFRVGVGLAQRELAVKAGLNQSQLCRYERGQMTPSTLTVTRICQALGVHQTEFFQLYDTLQRAEARREGRPIKASHRVPGVREQMAKTEEARHRASTLLAEALEVLAAADPDKRP
jgi:transcriptional regulator with XRE-family HTH domain